MKKNLTKPVIAVLLGLDIQFLHRLIWSDKFRTWLEQESNRQQVCKRDYLRAYLSSLRSMFIADLLVLNSIEFWTGNKVIGQVGTTKDVMGKDGRMYAIKTLKNGYEITDPDGEKSYFVFDKKHKSWSYSKDGDIRELFSFNEDGSIQACLPSGEKINVPADANGLYQVRMAMNDGLFYAFNK